MNFTHVLETPPSSDWINLALLFIGIFILIIFSEVIRKKLHWSQEATRKIVHISVGLLLLLTPLLLKTSLPLVVISMFFTVFNFVALKKNLLRGIHIDRHNLGTVYYAFSFLILVLLFWTDYKIIIIAAMMVMAVGDAAAAIVGHNIRNPHTYHLIRDLKSREGSATMFLVSTVAIFLTFLLYPPNLATSNHPIFYLLLFSLMTAAVATAAEALGDRGNDNLFVPLLTAVVLYFLLSGAELQHFQFLFGMLLGGMVAWSSYKVRFLTTNGSMATFLLASVIFGFGGWKWTIPITTFFLLSSLLSKMGKTSYEDIFEKGSRRDYLQVWANGGVAGLLMIWEILKPHPYIYLAYLGAMAAATADTWATEIGVRIGRKPRLISTFKPVSPGTSGGVTLGGLLGAMLGALILALTGFGFLAEYQTVERVLIIFLITLAGMAASLVDSFLGATVQVQYRCDVCHKITEKRFHCQTNQTVPISGLKWMSNDMVNFINTLTGSLFTLWLLKLFSVLNPWQGSY
jgi:uncharacterized protein (TIGR00297 family)